MLHETDPEPPVLRKTHGSKGIFVVSVVERAGQKHPQKQQSTELRVPGLPLQLALDASNLVSLKKQEH